MKKRFQIMEVGNPDDWDEWLKSKIVKSSDITIKRYINYGLIFEDIRTIIHLNQIIKELLQEKIFFLKVPKVKNRSKKPIDFEDLKLDVETDNTLLIQSLYVTTIVTYAKWFTKSSGGNKTKLESVEIYKNSPKSITESHKLAMHLRNFYFAHGGSEELETTYPLYVKDPLTNKENLFSIPSKTRLPSIKLVRRFEKLYAEMIKVIDIKMYEMKDKVIESIKKSVPKF